MNPLDFLKAADILKGSPEEASRRSAVSRAYYSLFHYIRVYLVRHNIPVPNDHTAHEKIPRYLRNSGLPRARELGSTVADLKDDRIEADYEMDVAGPDRNACELLVYKARLGVKEFNSCKGSTLVQGIKQYLKKIREGI